MNYSIQIACHHEDVSMGGENLNYADKDEIQYTEMR